MLYFEMNCCKLRILSSVLCCISHYFIFVVAIAVIGTIIEAVIVVDIVVIIIAITISTVMIFYHFSMSVGHL